MRDWRIRLKLLERVENSGSCANVRSMTKRARKGFTDAELKAKAISRWENEGGALDPVQGSSSGVSNGIANGQASTTAGTNPRTRSTIGGERDKSSTPSGR